MDLQASIARFLTRAANSLLKPARIAEVSPPPLWFNSQRIGGELTPEEVGNIILRADQGYLYQLIDLAREAREKDCHLHACLSTFELSLAGMDLHITPASDAPRDVEIAGWVERMLADFGPTAAGVESALSLPDLIQFLASGYFYSHAVAELIWAKRDGKLVPVTAVPVQARRFIYDQTSAELRFWDFYGGKAYPGINLLADFPDRFVQFTPTVLGTGPSREGLMRPLVWASLFRTWAIRDWLSLAEMAWKPWRVVVGAYLFGGVTLAQFQAQALGVELPSQYLAMLPYVATIVVLALISRDVTAIRRNAPASLGRPFHPEA